MDAELLDETGDRTPFYKRGIHAFNFGWPEATKNLTRV